jgi:hypothetical protein
MNAHPKEEAAVVEDKLYDIGNVFSLSIIITAINKR